MRTCERVDPQAIWGKPLCELDRDEMMEFMGYERVREAEESAAWNKMWKK